MKYSDNEMWSFYERIKNELRDAGCRGLANEIYKRQLKLESQLTKEFLCQS